MFTGLIETIGQVVAAERRGSALRLRVDLGCAAEGVGLGDSINLAGACQTVAALDGPVAAFDAVAETLEKTTLGRWKPGTRVNVERSLRPGDRLGGHFVAGHVDATGRVAENRERADGWRLRVECGGAPAGDRGEGEHRHRRGEPDGGGAGAAGLERRADPDDLGRDDARRSGRATW